MREKISRMGILLGVAAFGIVWYMKPVYSQNEAEQLLLESLVFRILGSVVFLSLCLLNVP